MNKIQQAQRLINQIGDDTYIVGGAVRDIIMGIEPNDIDIATAQPIQQIIDSDFNTYGIGNSFDFGIVGVSFQGEEYEVAQFRSDGDYSDDRRPDSVELGATIEEDAKRRDFTINAMYMDADGIIHDFHNGQHDIRSKVISTVGDPDKRFEEDALRILRAYRFAAKYKFKIDSATKNAMIRNSDRLKSISVERITAELFKVASYGGPAMAKYLNSMVYDYTIQYILPELMDMMEYDQHYKHHPEGAMVYDKKTDEYVPYSKKKHGDEPSDRYILDNGSVYDHVMAALKITKSKDPMVVLGILFHDIGKPISAELHSSHKGFKFLGHDKKGVEVFAKIAKRMKFTSKQTEEISFCIQYHMRFHAVPKKASKIIPIRQSPYYVTLKEVALADDSCRGEAFDSKHLQEVFDAIEVIYEKFGEKDEFDKKMKSIITGQVIMKEFPDIKGTEIGKYMVAAKEFIIEREFKVTTQDVIDFVKTKFK